jgi:hypothetical protein
MIILDRMLIGGIKFVLGKVADAVEAEMTDETALREELLAAQMQVELGEMSDEDFRALEGDVLARLRAIREARGGGAPIADVAGHKVTGVEAEIYGGDKEEE